MLTRVCRVPTATCQVRDAVDRGDAAMGTVDSWLVWCLTGGARGGVHVTDGEGRGCEGNGYRAMRWRMGWRDALGMWVSTTPRGGARGGVHVMGREVWGRVG